MSSTKSAEETGRHLSQKIQKCFSLFFVDNELSELGYAHVTIERFRIQWKNIDWLC